MAVSDNLVYETSTTTGTGNFTLAGAQSGFKSFNSSFGTGGTDVFFYFISHTGAAEWEVGTGHLSASTTLVRDSVIYSSNSGAAVNFSAGSKNVTSDFPATFQVPSYAADGRLTLTTGTPVLTSNVTAATTIYYTPYVGNRVAVWNGEFFENRIFSELSLSISGYTSNTNYDVWIYNNSGTLTLDTTAWTNATTRATALVRQDGVLVKSGDATRRYLGTFRTTGTTGQTGVVFGSAGTGSQAGNFLLWNMYNRLPVASYVGDTTDTWTYATAAYRQARASTGNQIGVLVGLSEVVVRASAFARATTASTTSQPRTGIGIDSTTADSAQISLRSYAIASAAEGAPVAYYNAAPGAGYRTYAWLEYGEGGVTLTFFGDHGGAMQSGMFMNWDW